MLLNLYKIKIGYIFNSPEPKAHKETLQDGHDPASVCRRFFSETAWPIKFKFYVELHWVVALKVC